MPFSLSTICLTIHSVSKIYTLTMYVHGTFKPLPLLLSIWPHTKDQIYIPSHNLRNPIDDRLQKKLALINPFTFSNTFVMRTFIEQIVRKIFMLINNVMKKRLEFCKNQLSITIGCGRCTPMEMLGTWLNPVF